MKKFFKNSKLTIISFLILLAWGFFELISCKGEIYYCASDPIVMYYHLFADKNLYYLEILAPLFVIIPASYQFHSELHTGYIKNCLTRTEYKKYLLKHYISALKNIFILPLFMIIMLLLCCFWLGSFDFGNGVQFYGYYSGAPDLKYASRIFELIIVCIINLTSHSILYVNIGLFNCKKYSNFLVSIILSYLTFIGLFAVTEVFIGNILLAAILDIHNISSSLNLANVWLNDDVISLSFTVFYGLALATLSSIIVWFKYKNKEGVLIECEK